MKIKRTCFLAVFAAFLLLWAGNDSKTYASEPADSDTSFAVHYITGIRNESFFLSWPEEIFYTDEAESVCDHLSDALRTATDAYVDGTNEKIKLNFSLDRMGADFSIPGSYTVKVTLLAPDGFLFAEGVLQEFTIPVLIKDAAEPILITSLFNQQVVDQQHLIPVDGVSEWDDCYRSLTEYLTNSLYGLSDDGSAAALDLVSFDVSGLDLSVPGDYTLTAELKVSESNTLPFILSEELQTLEFHVKVSRPGDFDLAFRNLFPDSIHFSYLSGYYPQVQVYYLESEASLPEEELKLSDFQVWPDTESVFASAGIFKISRNVLELYRHYYFCLWDGVQYSTIVQVVDDGTSPSYIYMGGDRDGGDTDGNRPSENPDEDRPPLGQTPEEPSDPAPPDPDTGTPEPGTGEENPDGEGQDSQEQENDSGESNNTDTESEPEEENNSSSSGNPPVSDTGSSGNDAVPAAADASIPSGGSIPAAPSDKNQQENHPEENAGGYFTVSELQRLLESGGGSLRFSEEGILAILPEDTLSGFSLEESDTVEICLNWTGDTSFEFWIRVNGNPVTEISSATLMVPYTPSSEDASVYLANESEKAVSEGSRDSGADVYTFQIQETGVFKIRERLSSIPAENSSGTSAGLSQDAPDPDSPHGLHLPENIFPIAAAALILLAGGVCLLIYRKGKRV